MRLNSVILAINMNPFRIIILLLLTISLGMMGYIVLVVIPDRQTEYAQYQSTLQMARFNERNDAHQARMDQIAPRTEGGDLKTASDELAQAQLAREAALAEAEERNIIAAARAKEEQAAAEAAAAAEREKKATQGFEMIGEVVSYDKEWATIIINPIQGAIITNGLRIAVMQQAGIICEATVDTKDEISGQIIATMQMSKIGNTEPKSPAMGDKVIVSPFESSADIRNAGDSYPDTSTPVATPVSEGLQDVEGTLVPLP